MPSTNFKRRLLSVATQATSAVILCSQVSCEAILISRPCSPAPAEGLPVESWMSFESAIRWRVFRTDWIRQFTHSRQFDDVGCGGHLIRGGFRNSCPL